MSQVALVDNLELSSTDLAFQKIAVFHLSNHMSMTAATHASLNHYRISNTKAPEFRALLIVAIIPCLSLAIIIAIMG